MQHSKIVGGSSAGKVIACPGSVALCAAMPARPSSSYADEGTLLHIVVMPLVDTLNEDTFEHTLKFLYGTRYKNAIFTPELYESKIAPALAALCELDPENEIEYCQDVNVDFGDFMPGVFGSLDFAGRIGSKAVILDWKFGDGVPVSAHENSQLLFYAAAARRTKGMEWLFEGAEKIELIIVQPTRTGESISRWTTTQQYITEFENTLKAAVVTALKPNAPLQAGTHCRWCAAKPICPIMTGEVDRVLKTQLLNIDANQIGYYLQTADVVEKWIADLKALALQMAEHGVKVPGHKLVAKRGSRVWLDQGKAQAALKEAGLSEEQLFKKEFVSPAQAEKLLKKKLDKELTVTVSSGNTLAILEDKRPEKLLIGQQLKTALLKLQ